MKTEIAQLRKDYRKLNKKYHEILTLYLDLLEEVEIKNKNKKE